LVLARLALACASEPDKPTAGASVDGGKSDLPEVMFGGNDLAPLDGLADASPADTSSGDTAAGQPTAFSCQTPHSPGCPCKEASDCDNSLCIATPDGWKCALACSDQCPAGFKCQLVSPTGGDSITLCVPRWGVLCNPCSATADCASLGVAGSLCVDRGEPGRFCGAACVADGDCPAGFACAAAKDKDGVGSKQCLPAPGATAEADGFGACTCSQLAMDQGLETKCYLVAKDADGKPKGLCKGVRSCGVQGLTPCSAVAPAPESCNGDDDDCDGQTDEGACDDNNVCTTDTCDAKTQQCQHAPAPGNCDADGNACTEGDTCKGGVCTKGAVKTCDDGNVCTIDACDPAAGCTKTDAIGSPCDDGNGCSVGDACALSDTATTSAAVCKPAPVKVCAAAGPCLTSACNPADGMCSSSNKGDAEPCDDASQCTEKDACAKGECKGAAVNCDDGNSCTQDACQYDKGCVHTPAAAPCDDGNACTSGDACGNGACSGVPKDPTTTCDDGNPCTTEGCDPSASGGKGASSGCTNTANAAKCDDGNPCTAGDQCAEKACKAGANTCQCQSDADCAKSEDGNFCNGTLMCDKATPAFKCAINPATVVECQPAPDKPCQQNVCDAKSGKCNLLPMVDDKPCDADGSPCTVGDACAGGTCKAGKALDCNDGNPCTSDACDLKLGCTHTANSAACNADDSACTVGDACSGQKCIAGTAKNCADSEPCTADTCDPKTGDCKHDGAAAQGQACDADGNLCTGPDTCKCTSSFCTAATCVVGPALNCDDQNPCTTDACDKQKGCTYTPFVDQAGCGLNQWCLAGKCVPKPYCGNGKIDQPEEECDDGNQVSGDGCSATCKKEGAKLPQPGGLVITEIMVDPAGTDDNMEWFEVYNPGPAPVQMTGLVIKDNVGQEFVGQQGLVLESGKYFLFGSGPAPGGLKPDYVYSYGTSKIQLANAGDEVTILANGQVVDQVVYTGGKNGWKTAKSGASYQLHSGKLDSKLNDVGGNWCNSTTPFGSGGEYGTPGKANLACP
jgi:cysteine-rich repeat protein